ncbi:hypothetical protein M5X06_12985 [Paenibacillus alvei]|uniref:Copper amine oxidase-like N-terminal domain-containing protein n=1 Tax=Paenibacillus alvei TaxID=44250 RepID=A0ABT4GUR4_PAEAL|nr:hypothetical protein [Paenibacillus alvei]MCY9760436.1 hypothetical protein [Paenibacillus alvei]MCY9767728.1 hypothetical protein [Paenibacillus alvei]
MKTKVKYLTVGALVGIMMTVSVSAFADNIKSMIGKKVDGEAVVKINSESLSDRALVVGGKAYLPVRSISDALGASVKSVNNGVISLTTNGEKVKDTPPVDNKYSNRSKQDLEKDLDLIKNNQLKFIVDEREELVKNVEQAKKDGATAYVEEKEKIIKDYDERIAKLNTEVESIEAELARKN